MIDKDKLRHKDTWSGVYKNMAFEIQNWQEKDLPDYYIKDSDKWTFYVYFSKNKMPVELFNLLTAGLKETKYGSCNYIDTPLADLDWHYGITFGQLTRNENAELICVKCGCDYSHYWDEGNEYNLDDLLIDVERCIDGFVETYKTQLQDATPQI